MKEISQLQNYGKFLEEIKSQIRSAQIKAAI
ncbi:MAG: hypothetical protein K0S74_1892 [Chlamydiales bacterium]|jgi:hypothetical protein|nr:hypothetical protein [Chlamydiales bacterium]